MNRIVAWVAAALIALGLIASAFVLLGMLLVSASATLVGAVFAVLYVLVVVVLLRLLPVWPRMGSAGGTWLWVLACLAWGGGFAMVPAFAVAPAVMDLAEAAGWDAAAMSFGGAYPEEPGKALGVLLILLAFRGLNRPWHGLATGALVGLGFEAVENITYGTTLGLLDPSSDLMGMAQTWAVRTFLAPIMHVVWTAIAGWGIGQALFVAGKSAGWRLGVAFGWLAAAFGLHFLWNYAGGEVATYATMIAAAVIMYPVFIALLVIGSRRARADRSYAYTPGALTSLGQLPRDTPPQSREINHLSTRDQQFPA